MTTLQHDTQKDKEAQKLGSTPTTPAEFDAAFAAAKEYGNEDENNRLTDLLRMQLAAAQERASCLAHAYGAHVSPHGFTIRDITDLMTVIPGEEESRYDGYRARLEESFVALVRPDLPGDDAENKDARELMEEITAMRSSLRVFQDEWTSNEVAKSWHGIQLRARLFAARALVMRKLDPAKCVTLESLRGQCHAIFAAADSARSVAEPFAKLKGIAPTQTEGSLDYALHLLGDVHREVQNAYDSAHRALRILDEMKDQQREAIEAARVLVRDGGDHALRLEQDGAAFIDAVSMSKNGGRSLRAIGKALAAFEKRARSGRYVDLGDSSDLAAAHVQQYANRVLNTVWFLENVEEPENVLKSSFGSQLDAVEHELELVTNVVDADTVDGAVDATQRALDAIREAKEHHAKWLAASAYAKTQRTVLERRAAVAVAVAGEGPAA